MIVEHLQEDPNAIVRLASLMGSRRAKQGKSGSYGVLGRSYPRYMAEIGKKKEGFDVVERVEAATHARTTATSRVLCFSSITAHRSARR